MLRFLSRGASLIVTGTFIAGIGALIATDLFGEAWVGAVWERFIAPADSGVDLSELESARDFSFFTETVASEAGLTVTTGVKFATFEDLLAGRESERWCYTILVRQGELLRQISLGTQTSGEAPNYTDLTAIRSDELAPFGLDSRTLAQIARSACRFKGTPESDVELRNRLALGAPQ